MADLYWTLDSYARHTSGSIFLLVSNSKLRTVDDFFECRIIFSEYLSFLDIKELSE